MTCFTSQACVPSACHSGFMNSAASQSSNSGCVGHSPCDPMSSSTLVMPMPKNWRHSRLTKTRAVSGFCWLTSQLARSSRVARCPPVSNLPRKAGTAGCTISPDSSIQFPRDRIRVSVGVVASETTTRGMAASSSADSFSRFATSITSGRASGEAHWKCPATAVFCSGVRWSSATRRALRTASGISLPFSGPGHEYSPDESATRNRPMVARR